MRVGACIGLGVGFGGWFCGLVCLVGLVWFWGFFGVCVVWFVDCDLVLGGLFC